MLAVAYAKVLLGPYQRQLGLPTHIYPKAALAKTEGGHTKVGEGKNRLNPKPIACLLARDVRSVLRSRRRNPRRLFLFPAPNSVGENGTRLRLARLGGRFAAHRASAICWSLHRRTRNDASARGEAIGRSPRRIVLAHRNHRYSAKCCDESLSQWWCAPNPGMRARIHSRVSQAERAPELIHCATRIAAPRRMPQSPPGIFQAASLMCLHAEVTKYRPRRAN